MEHGLASIPAIPGQGGSLTGFALRRSVFARQKAREK
jgi:hypothetical protein